MVRGFSRKKRDRRYNGTVTPIAMPKTTFADIASPKLNPSDHLSRMETRFATESARKALVEKRFGQSIEKEMTEEEIKKDRSRRELASIFESDTALLPVCQSPPKFRLHTPAKSTRPETSKPSSKLSSPVAAKSRVRKSPASSHASSRASSRASSPVAKRRRTFKPAASKIDSASETASETSTCTAKSAPRKTFARYGRRRLKERQDSGSISDMRRRALSLKTQSDQLLDLLQKKRRRNLPTLLSTVRELLETGADANARTSDGRFALLLSLDMDDIDPDAEVCRLLLQHNANANVCNNIDSALDQALVQSNVAAVRHLLSHGGLPNVMPATVLETRPSLIRFARCHDAGEEYDEATESLESLALRCLNTALWESVQNNDAKFARALLHHGACVDFVDTESGETPLYNAVRQNCDSALVSLLLEYGADVNRVPLCDGDDTESDDFVPLNAPMLCHACVRSSANAERVCLLLLQCACDVQARLHDDTCDSTLRHDCFSGSICGSLWCVCVCVSVLSVADFVLRNCVSSKVIKHVRSLLENANSGAGTDRTNAH
ncbi:MAG: hypothetical protein MHM6MM_000138 [Cercozoa sp. M6MM]